MQKQKTTIIGILNITPDSFSDGGLYYDNIEKAVTHAKQMLADGADIIDIGGESTRPGSESISETEECRRVIPVIQALREQLDPTVRIAIDTNKAFVAQEALAAGANIVNSLGGFMFDPKLAKVIAAFQCPIMIYHIKGLPKTMQKELDASVNILGEITNFFEKQIAYGIANNVQRKNFILDPGIGFGKTLEQNLDIIRNIKSFKAFRLPIAIGVSRKSHLGTLLQTTLAMKSLPPPKERLEASLAETAVAVMNGATMIRTHDVLQTKKFLAILDQFKTQ